MENAQLTLLLDTLLYLALLCLSLNMLRHHRATKHSQQHQSQQQKHDYLMSVSALCLAQIPFSALRLQHQPLYSLA